MDVREDKALGEQSDQVWSKSALWFLSSSDYKNCQHFSYDLICDLAFYPNTMDAREDTLGY